MSERKPPAWLASGIEVKRDAAREPAFDGRDRRLACPPERIPVLATLSLAGDCRNRAVAPDFLYQSRDLCPIIQD